METDEYHQGFLKGCDLETMLIGLNSFTAVVGVAGNAVVLRLLGFHIPRNAMSAYIFNLAVVDFIILCFHCLHLLNGNASFHLSDLFLLKSLILAITISYMLRMGILSAINLEHCLSILCPIWYRCQRPKYTSCITCLLIWAMTMALSILQWHICSMIHEPNAYDTCHLHGFSITIFVIVLFAILVGSFVVLQVVIFCGSDQVRVTRLYVTILLTVLVFFLCGMPFYIHQFLLLWIPVDNKYHCYYLQLFVVLSCINSSANPIIYFFIGLFRQQPKNQSLKLVLQRALQDTPEEIGQRGSLHQETLEMSGIRVEQG
ncbi:mas-related G-protein coupled receptor member A-like [Nannospalax galili]|uniref:mas-related G-protein coupled receptor member A-like n=1 Tax=Nannospalax galili TaxID=1026970 RepID=UPI0004ED349D|nr:mas-related G-protein coupled receptor member A-like [Nannospalax galili]